MFFLYKLLQFPYIKAKKCSLVAFPLGWSSDDFFVAAIGACIYKLRYTTDNIYTLYRLNIFDLKCLNGIFDCLLQRESLHYDNL